MDQLQQKVTFTNAFGAVLAMAGVAIGLGNVWRFPYMMGQYGGSAFLIVYLVIVIAIGVPALMAELALGRHTKCGPLHAIKTAGMWGGTTWGWLLIVIITMATALYNVVVGQVLYYAVKYAPALTNSAASPDLRWPQESFGIQFAYVLAAMAISCFVLGFGVRAGIERVSKLLLPAFAALFLIIIIRVLTLDGAAQGVRTLFVPDWTLLTPQTLLGAVGQAIFSLGLGGTMMVMYGSYIRNDEKIPRYAVLVAAADVGAALLAGLIIVPAAVALSVELKSGPPLMFEVMPLILGKMPAGNWFGLAFFLAVFIVAMLSVMGGFEVIVVSLGTAFGLGRRAALLVIFTLQSLLVVPLILSPWYFGFTDLIWITSLMPIGSLLAVVALAWSIKRTATLQELRAGGTKIVPNWLFYWIKYVIPLGIGFTLVYGLMDKLL